MVSHNHADDAERKAENESSGLEGVRFVFSGGHVSGDWSYWQALIKQNGGIVSESVSEDTDYLVIGTPADSGERESAYNQGVPTIEEQGFRALLDSSTISPKQKQAP